MRGEWGQEQMGGLGIHKCSRVIMYIELNFCWLMTARFHVDF